MSPRKFEYDAAALSDRGEMAEPHDLSVEISHDRDRLEVQSQTPAPGQTVCTVTASRAFRRRLCRGLRGAGLLAQPLDAADVETLGEVTDPVVAVIEMTTAADTPPRMSSQGISVGLLPDATAEAHIAALLAGWSVVVDRGSPVDVIVEVVWEMVQGRTLLRSDVAQRLAAGTPTAAHAPGHSDAEASEAPEAGPERVAHEAIAGKSFSMAASGVGLGDPRTALAPVAGSDAWQQMFDEAWVLWQPGTGACVLRRGGAIATRYAELGGPRGYLGCPTTDETDAGAGAFCRFTLHGGAIVWHPQYGVHETYGEIGEYWLDTLGGPEGPWGFPMSDEYDAGDGTHVVDFEGGRLVRRHDRGVGEMPKDRDFEPNQWLALLPDPPRREGSKGWAAIIGIREPAPGEDGEPTFFYTAATAGLLARVHDPLVVTAARQIEHCRSMLASCEPPADTPPALLRTTVTAQEALATTGATLPPGVDAEQYHHATLDLWRDVWDDGPEPSTTTSSGPTKLTWAGFTADGHLEFLLSTLFLRSADAKTLFLRAGIAVEVHDGRRELVAADTEQGWRLRGDDAERYIRCDRRLLTLFAAVLHGTLTAEALGADPEEAPRRNEALRTATLDAMFLTVISHAGRLPGWSLQAQWTRELRAAVAHNLHLGCLSGWDAFRDTEGDAVEVVRVIVHDFFCGPAVLLAQSMARLEGPAAHGALAEAAASFPPVTNDDDGHGRYIVAARRRRRVDRRS